MYSKCYSPIIENYYKNIHSPTVVNFSGSPSDDWHIEKLRKHCRTMDYIIETMCALLIKKQNNFKYFR